MGTMTNATLNNRIGYICVECYNTNIWAKSQTEKDRFIYSQLKVLRKKRGQPRIDIGIEFVIYAKLLQISRSRKLSMWKA